jgi:hypothetical protein
MLGCEGSFRPAGAGLEPDADEVADFAIDAVADGAFEFLSRRRPAAFDA